MDAATRAREMGLTIEDYLELGGMIDADTRWAIEMKLRQLQPKSNGELIMLNLAIGIVRGTLG